MVSKRTSILRYVALLHLVYALSSALHLCRLSPFRYYPPHPYSKMFVGGLFWGTTDGTPKGTPALLILLSHPFCNVISID